VGRFFPVSCSAHPEAMGNSAIALNVSHFRKLRIFDELYQLRSGCPALDELYTVTRSFNGRFCPQLFLVLGPGKPL
jgi:hypothetical protein